MLDEQEQAIEQEILQGIEVQKTMATPGWQVIVEIWNVQREAIIAKGKKGRSNDSNIKMWAELDGFDKCATIPEKTLRKAEDRLKSREGERVS